MGSLKNKRNLDEFEETRKYVNEWLKSIFELSYGYFSI